MGKRSKIDREKDLELIEELWLKGEHYRQIVEKINQIRPYDIHFTTVGNDVKKILIYYHQKRESFVSGHVSIELEKSYERERILWEAWEKSVKKGKYMTTKQVNTNNVKVQLISSPEGYFKFMECMLNEAFFRCKILGLLTNKYRIP